MRLVGLLVLLHIAAYSSQASGLPWKGRHLDCEKVTIQLTKAQKVLFKAGKKVPLTAAQKTKLREKWNYAPEKLEVLSIKSARESCTCFYENVGVLTGRTTVEIPEYLSGKHHEEREPKVERREIRAWGFIGNKGQLAIPHRFRSIEDFKDGMAEVDFSEELRMFPKDLRFIDKSGEIVPPDAVPRKPPGITVYDYHDGLATFQDRATQKHGFAKQNGAILIPARFDDADILESGFREGLAPVCENGKWGFIDQTGAYVIRPRFAHAHQFHDGLAAVQLFDPDHAGVKPCVPTARWTFVDRSGKLWKQAFVVVHSFSEGVTAAEVREPKRVITSEDEMFYPALHKQLLNRNGELVDGVVYDQIGLPADGMVAVRQGKLVGFVDLSSRKLSIKPQFRAVGRFSEGLAAVAIPDGNAFQLAYIKKDGQFAFPARFPLAHASFDIQLNGDENKFSDGLAMISVNGKYGFIGHDGTWVVQPHYDQAHRFSEGLAAVCRYAPGATQAR